MNQKKQIWKNRSFLFLITAQLASALGEGIVILALLALFGFEKDATPLEMAMVVLATSVPTVVFGLIAGLFADRLERKTLMMLSDIARAVIMFSIVFTTDTWQIYLLLVLKGTFEAIFTPAKNGKLREIVSVEHMDQAVGISTVIDYGCRIIGPAVGGVLVAVFGTMSAFYMNAGGFLLSALLLLGVPKRPEKYRGENKSDDIPLLMQMKEGFSFIKRSSFLMYGTFVFSISMFVITLADAQLITLFRLIPGGTTELFGVIMGATGLGTLAVAGWLSSRSGVPAIPAMSIGSIGIGIAFGLLAGFTQIQLGLIWIWCPLLALLGGGMAGAVIVPFQATAQKKTPENLTSRVFGVINSASTFATIVGPLSGGILATFFGIIPVFIVSGGLLLVVGLLLLSNRKMEMEESDVTESF